MSEISQPTPIKPAWPVRRDESRGKRPEIEPQDKKKKNQPSKPVINGGDKHPKIDDYA
ncbi:hypothetical protein [Sedimenticola hydrogenitrophicus]|uniref:hypothetical protein n=1 Tax=Sedimenticola hydrogenitrophicus TaxID=2967975 RepID=UPI0021A3A9D2|nr:hypothetical protein [Sedimenticola hydrogenitrophicus]